MVKKTPPKYVNWCFTDFELNFLDNSTLDQVYNPNNKKLIDLDYSKCIWVNHYKNPFRETIKMRYIRFGFEICPKTKRRHLQGWIQFYKPQRLSSMKKLHPRAHFEPIFGNLEQNQRYTSKDGKYYELGTPINKGFRASRVEAKNKLEMHQILNKIRSSKDNELQKLYDIQKYLQCSINVLKARVHISDNMKKNKNIKK